ncbi:YybS family protein [Ornithinibacillus contaminans]|uniref:YybS family protein n=1 Tax=Ornithinibacillus contaminans TaxID=694055 RepID=UPI00064DE0B5|nr:YybS family protein [Ornithinibacillus contaminans]
MNKSKQLTDGALLTTIFIVLLLITMYAPILPLFTTFVLAVPFVIYAAKYDWKPALLMFVATAILSILLGTYLALPLPFLAGLGGIMLGSAIYRERPPYEIWARGTIGFIAGILFTFVFSLLVLQVNVLDVFSEQLDIAFEQSEQIITQFGMGEVSDEQFAIIEQRLSLLKNLMPVAIVILSIGLALLNQWISYKILNRTSKQQLRFPKFRNMQFPPAIIWIYLIGILVSFVQPDPTGTIAIAVQNIVMLVGLLMVLQGFSFIFFYVHTKHLAKAIPIIAIVVTLFFAPLLLPLVRILGIIDIGFRLRSRMKK